MTSEIEVKTRNSTKYIPFCFKVCSMGTPWCSK